MFSAALVVVGGTLWPDRLTRQLPDDAFLESRVPPQLIATQTKLVPIPTERGLRRSCQPDVRSVKAAGSRGCSDPSAEWTPQAWTTGTQRSCRDRYVSTFYNADYLRVHGVRVAQPLPNSPQQVDIGVSAESWSRARLRSPVVLGV
jgi:hypothetical protein